MTIVLKDKTEIENVSFQETGANKSYNGTLSFSAFISAEELDKLFTQDNVSQMVLKATANENEQELSGYKLGSITVNYTDNTNFVRIMLSKVIG